MVRDLVGYGRDYPTVRWPDGARVAVSLVVHYEEGAERTPLEGDPDPEPATEGIVPEPGRRDFFVETFWEYGSRRGIWRLLEMLDRYGVKATFFCCGQALERNPQAAREVAAAGHEVAGHGYRWVEAYELDRQEEQQEIARAVEVLTRMTGRRPVGWHSRAPSMHTRELLLGEGGFIYHSDSFADDLPYFEKVNGQRILAVPYTMDVTDDKFWMPPGMAGYSRPDGFFNVVKGAFDRLYQEGATRPKMMSVGLHPRISGRPTRALQVERILAYLRSFPGVWIARREEIARWWMQHYGA